jgi:hypothetical protein
LSQLEIPLLVVALGSPFDITFLEEVKGCIVAYGPPAAPPYVAANMSSIVEFMFGDCPAKPRYQGGFTATAAAEVGFDVDELLRVPPGRLPVILGPRYPSGFGVTDDGAGFVAGARWDFGDGNQREGPSVKHVYAAAGEYAVKIDVVNAVGKATAITFPLTVAEKD